MAYSQKYSSGPLPEGFIREIQRTWTPEEEAAAKARCREVQAQLREEFRQMRALTPQDLSVIVR